MAKKYAFFSLIELLTVMAVIAVLLGITIGVFSLVRDKMNNSKTRAIIKQLDIAMQSYKLDQGYYFASNNAFATFTPPALPPSATYFKLNFNGVIDTIFIKCFEYQTLKGRGSILTVSGYSYIVDAWNIPILYKYPGTFNPQMFDIGSLGKDGYYGDKSTNTTNDPLKFGQGDDITNFNNN